jgi:hypothetical protein
MSNASLDDRFYRWIWKYVLNNSPIPGSNEIPELFRRRSNSMEVEETLHWNRLVLSRSSQMNARMSQIIESVKKEERCGGLIYLMFWIDGDAVDRMNLSERLIPLYIGIGERMHKKKKGIMKICEIHPSLGGWGYPNYYHIGELSRALKTGIGRHSNWAAKLFSCNQPPTLIRNVYWWGREWRSDPEYLRTARRYSIELRLLIYNACCLYGERINQISNIFPVAAAVAYGYDIDRDIPAVSRAAAKARRAEIRDLIQKGTRLGVVADALKIPKIARHVWPANVSLVPGTC